LPDGARSDNQWWNKRWGKLARRDVLIHYTPEKWEVEAREGGPEGNRKRVPADSEIEAVRIAERFMELGGDE
jgi:hypothetical protein